MRFLTHYEDYPIFEPAEGGYYYEGTHVVESYPMSNKKAETAMKELYRQARTEEPNEWVRKKDGIYRSGNFLGDGERYVIEKVQGSRTRGRRVYC